MTTPAFFALACLVAAGVALLHLIVPREPPGAQLPTARFVPQGPSVVSALAARPSDRAVLLLRMAALLAIGLAFADFRPFRSRVPVMTIVVADRSHAVADENEVVVAARSVLTGGNAILIAFDSTTRVVRGSEIQDTLSHLARLPVRGSVTGALIAALRVASEWQDRSDSIRLVLISPVRADETDAALDRVRALWPATVQVVPVRAGPESPPSPAAGVRLEWPADGHPPRATPRTSIDTVGAFIVADVVVVRPFERRWRPDTAGARIIGRWVDGQPAVVERTTASGCERESVVAFDTTHSLVRDPAMRRVLGALHRPCAAELRMTPRMPTPIAWERPHSGPLVASALLGGSDRRRGRGAAGWLALALVALALEWRLRARPVSPRRELAT